MIYFVPTNLNIKIVLGEDPKLFPILKEDPNNIFFHIISPYAIGKPLPNLLPTDIEIFQLPEEYFINSYMNYLQLAQMPFYDIMEFMMNEYYGYNPVIVTDMSDDKKMQIVECIKNYIYNRYGSKSSIITSVEDLQYAESSEIQNIRVFNDDKEYYLKDIVDGKALMERMDELEDLNSNEL